MAGITGRPSFLLPVLLSLPSGSLVAQVALVQTRPFGWRRWAGPQVRPCLCLWTDALKRVFVRDLPGQRYRLGSVEDTGFCEC